MADLSAYNSKFLGTNVRINPELYQGIVGKVRTLYRKSSPAGCSQNVKAEVRDIDKAVEANRLREQAVDQFADNELQKLNLFKSPKRNSRIQKSLTIQPKPKYRNTITFEARKTRTAGGMHCRRLSETQKPQKEVFQRTASMLSSNRPQTGVGNGRVKSRRLASLDAIMKSCDDLQPEIKPQMFLIETSQKDMKESTNYIKEYINDVEDCIRLADDQKKMEKLMETCRNSRRFSRDVEVDKDIKDEMLMVTRKLVQLGGTKVWRHNHSEFMASAEKVINSIPKVRS